MATNHERVGKALELLKAGLGLFVEREVKAAIKERRLDACKLRDYVKEPKLANKPITEWDVAGLLKLTWETWNDVFRAILGPAERGLVGEMRGHRNQWAHQEPFSGDDAYRALDSAARLLTAVSAPEAAEADKLKMELLRVRFDEQARGERRKKTAVAIEGIAGARLKPWREVVTPHRDVASGHYQQAEFAADLWQVHLGEGMDEYRDPVEFFRRTYLTESLKGLLSGGIRRIAGQGGDPVVQLQTNFGGGKTHSMLALYHLFSGVAPTELAGVDTIMQTVGTKALPGVRRVVLVGNRISPGNPITKGDGAIVRTFWGELAWQLGGRKAFSRIEADDEKATSPGDRLRELFIEYGPCLILIDEWVAYARQLHERSDLPAGSFETQFSFAQALTESARAAGNCLVVISLPASDTTGSPQTRIDDVEVGGQRGREALDRLRNVVGRIESSWQPASAEEGFEIVRRRLFEPFSEATQYRDRDVVARAFADLYQIQQQEFPPECRNADYERRIKAAYPIHPEVFDRLYTDWSTLVKFQRTRGVLRLMAAVIHSLWEQGDSNPLILPAHLAIDEPRVKEELTRYLPDNWTPVVEADVDGPNSLPQRLDGEVPNLGKFSACRRIARTIFLGSAPTPEAANQGLEDRRVMLGCVMPGESPGVFGDALRRLSGVATYLYQDGARYWYSTQPTVTRLAEERAARLQREPDKVALEMASRLRAGLREKGGFNRIHPLPQSGRDVPDDLDARLVVLGSDQPYSKEQGNAAQVAAKAILEFRGSAPRIYRNTLVFLAADKTRLQDLDEAVRRYLAWASILEEKEQLDLTPHQAKQAEDQKKGAADAVEARLPETWQWLLAPMQQRPGATVEWQAIRLSGQDALAVRASKRLKRDELLITVFAATRLRMELDRVPLWRGDHVPVKQIVEDFARYLYLPRVGSPAVILKAAGEGVSLLTWGKDTFAFADSYDDEAGRYRGLRGGQLVALPDAEAPGVLVKPDIACQQLDAENANKDPGKPVDTANEKEGPRVGPGERTGIGESPEETAGAVQLKRFHGTVTLDPARVGKGASQVADEVIAHLSGLVGARVTVTLEIEAELPDGAPDKVVRTVTENSRTLKFTSHGFEQE